MNVLAIDPGNTESAWCRCAGDRPIDFAKVANDTFVRQLRFLEPGTRLVIEYMEPRGMPMSQEEMDTQFWTGRFVQAAGVEWHPVKRREVKMHICGHTRAKDSNIRQALIDRFGGASVAIGGTKCPQCKGKGWFGAGRPTCLACNGTKWLHPPGPLHGITSDVWSALAIAITWWETKRQTIKGASDG
jgi:hypothetical protein